MNLGETIERDKKFYELGVEHNKILIKYLIEGIGFSKQETFTKKQVLDLLKGLLK